jgi:hypothetical protein
MPRTALLRTLLEYGIPVFDVPETHGRAVPELLAAAGVSVGLLAESENRLQ